MCFCCGWGVFCLSDLVFENCFVSYFYVVLYDVVQGVFFGGVFDVCFEVGLIGVGELGVYFQVYVVDFEVGVVFDYFVGGIGVECFDFMFVFGQQC